MDFLFWLVTVVGLLYYIRSVARRGSEEIAELRQTLAQAHARIDVLVKRLAEIQRGAATAVAPAADVAKPAVEEKAAAEVKPVPASPASSGPVLAPKPPTAVSPPPVRPPAPALHPEEPAVRRETARPAAAAYSGAPSSQLPRAQFPDVPVIKDPADRPVSTSPINSRVGTPLRSPDPETIKPPKPAGKKFSMALEEAVGTNWLPKLGVVIMVLGIALFTASQWEKIAPIGRIALFYLVGGGMLAGGIWSERREHFKILGRAMIGGGWAGLFFTTYAMHHVATAKVLDSLLIDLLLMLLCAGAMVWHTLKYNSQLVTGLAFLLAFSTITISHESAYSLIAGAILALAMTFIVLKREWYVLEIFGILASYLNHFYWLMPMVDRYGPHHAFPGYAGSAALVIFYWAVFRASYVIRKISDRELETLSTFSALLNTIMLLAVMRYQSVHPELAFSMLLILGAVELTLGQLPLLKTRRTAFLVLSTIGFCLMIGAVPFRYSGSPRAMLWLIGAEAFLFAGIFTQEKVFRRFGMLAAYLVAIQVAVAHVFPFLEKAILGAQPRSADLTSSVLLGSLVAAFYLDANYCRHRWRELFQEAFDAIGLTVLSYTAAAFLAFTMYFLLPAIRTGVTLGALALALAWLGAWASDTELRRQAHFFAVLGVLDVYLRSSANQGTAMGIPVRLLAFGGVATLIYLASYFVRRNRSAGAELMSAAYTWLGTAALALWAWTQFSNPSDLLANWPTAPLWMVLALAVGYLGKRWSRRALGWQSAALAGLSFLVALTVNLDATGSFLGMNIRLASTAFVAAGIYISARFCPEERIARLYSWPGTFLLAALAYKEGPSLWIAPLWLGMASVLLLVAKRFTRTELLWQAHLLSLLAVLRIISVNFDSTYQQTRGQLITCAISIVLIYCLTWLLSPKAFSSVSGAQESYSWAGSLLLLALLWFQLSSGAVAIAWGMAGLLMFETGASLKWLPLRKQGYAAVAASFMRIFYADINASGAAGEISPRVFTIVPLSLIYFYVYWRLHSAVADNFQALRKLKTEFFLACMGTAAVAALLRFEIAPDWVVASWAVMTLGLIAACWFTAQEVFLWQALAMLVPIAFRTSMHNFYQSREGLTADRTWLVVAVTSAILMAGLPLAFSIRNRTRDGHDGGGLPFVSALTRRPEQWLFFVPVGLVTALLFLKMRSGLITLSWGVEGLLIFVLALFVGERSFRLTGLALLLVCVGKILLIDAWNMNDPRDRYLTLIVVGALLLLVSFLYGKYRERLRAFL